MTKLIYNELYNYEEMPKHYDFDLCNECRHYEWFEEENPGSDEDEPFFTRTCDKCGSMREISFDGKLVYFFGEDYKEVKFYR
ncbi:hypothetical protein HGG78_17995 [Vibrio aestuarianus]|uniref:hypothetical protein n=1 Tax=Vibrio aestuarianus TaxID=28171 RepID=UPI00155877B5|nr:hypothetical protein [Vibrio aestuarianus]NGZ15609.1 hypothetical protein [Vibrio aestuarianus]NKZ51757.1 hypothetical protein [Vibrio aestuarianus]